MHELLQDLKYGFRILFKNPGFTAVAVLTLALGIGANTAIFTMVNAVLLRPLPYPDAGRIVHVSPQTKTGQEYSVTVAQFLFWKEHSRAFEAMAAYAYNSYFNLWTGSEPVSVKGLYVSEGFFRVLGASPNPGRGFSQEEDRPGAPGAVILSYGLWQRHFAGAPDTLGRTILLNGRDYTIVGIMPRDFQFAPVSDLWLPLMPANSGDPGENFEMLARIKPGLSLQSAQADATIVFDRYRREAGNALAPTIAGMRAISYRTWLGGDVSRSLLVLLAAVGIVLLIASANVVNLLLARMTTRHMEIGLRAAFGAGPWRLSRQLLTESLLLACIGGAAGLLLAPWTLDAMLALIPQDSALIPLAGQVRLDLTVLGFTLAASLAAGFATGMISAMELPKQDLQRWLREGIRTQTGSEQHGIRDLVVIAEMALSIVLVAGAVLLVRSLVDLHSVQLGFAPRNLWTAQMSLPAEKFKTTAQVWNFERQVLDSFQKMPGVVSAATVSNLPLERGQRIPMKIDGLPYQVTEHRAVSPDYFRTMGIEMSRGRSFLESDESTSTPVAIVNEALVRAYWPKGDPLGESIVIGRGGWEEAPRRIVGVVADSKLNRLSEAVPPAVFVPQSQVKDRITQYSNQVFLATWVIRSSAPLDLAAVQRAVQQVDRQQPVVRLRSLAQVLGDSIAGERFYTTLMAVFAGLALLLAAIGIYGVMSYSIRQRTHEMGVRIALGAGKAEMLKLALGRGLRLAVVGTSIGFVAALGLTRVLSGMLFGVRPTDITSFIFAALLACFTALLASYLPARRASRLDPNAALRNE
jgi:predicted permease